MFSVAEAAFLFLISHKIFYRFLGDLLIEYYYGGGYTQFNSRIHNLFCIIDFHNVRRYLMKMLKRILAAVAASAVSLCIFTACGSDPKYDTSIFINAVRARTGYNVKESKALDDALQAGMDALDPNVDYSTTNEDPDYKGHEQTAYDAIKAKLGDPGATKYQYVKSGSLRGNLRYFARNGESPVAAYAIYNAPLRDFDKEYKELNSAQLYEAFSTYFTNQKHLFLSNSNHQTVDGKTASYVPEEISVSIKTITVDGKTSPHIFVLLKGTMSIDS